MAVINLNPLGESLVASGYVPQLIGMQSSTPTTSTTTQPITTQAISPQTPQAPLQPLIPKPIGWEGMTGGAPWPNLINVAGIEAFLRGMDYRQLAALFQRIMPGLPSPGLTNLGSI